MVTVDFTLFSDMSRLLYSLANLLDACTRLMDDMRIIIITATATAYVGLIIFAIIKIHQCCSGGSSKKSSSKGRWKSEDLLEDRVTMNNRRSSLLPTKPIQPGSEDFSH